MSATPNLTPQYVSDWQALFEHRMMVLQDMEDLYDMIWNRSKAPDLGGMVAKMRGEFKKCYCETMEGLHWYTRHRSELRQRDCRKYEERLDYVMEELLEIVRDLSDHLDQYSWEEALTPVLGKDLEEEWEGYKDEVDRILDECVK